MLVPGFERYCRPRTETPGEVGAGLYLFFRTSLIRKTKNNLKNLIFDIDFPLYFIKGNPRNPRKLYSQSPLYIKLYFTKELQRILLKIPIMQDIKIENSASKNEIFQIIFCFSNQARPKEQVQPCGRLAGCPACTTTISARCLYAHSTTARVGSVTFIKISIRGRVVARQCPLTTVRLVVVW